MLGLRGFDTFLGSCVCWSGRLIVGVSFLELDRLDDFCIMWDVAKVRKFL